jgi:hypothetical protein
MALEVHNKTSWSLPRPMQSNSFKFLDDHLNHLLLALLRKCKIKHRVDRNGVIHFSSEDEEVVENELICSVRDKAFPTWQLLTRPPEWTERYKKYMSNHGIPFCEEQSNGESWFLIPRKYRPHRWKLDGSLKAEVVP